jgi:hypothetical protein
MIALSAAWIKNDDTFARWAAVAHSPTRNGLVRFGRDDLLRTGRGNADDLLHAASKLASR